MSGFSFFIARSGRYDRQRAIVASERRRLLSPALTPRPPTDPNPAPPREVIGELFLNVVSLTSSRRGAARDSSDATASRAAFSRHSAGYFDGRPRGDLSRDSRLTVVSTEARHLQARLQLRQDLGDQFGLIVLHVVSSAGEELHRRVREQRGDLGGQ